MSDSNTSDDDINLEEMAEISAEEYATENNNNTYHEEDTDYNSSENSSSINSSGWVNIPSRIETKRYVIDQFLNRYNKWKEYESILSTLENGNENNCTLIPSYVEYLLQCEEGSIPTEMIQSLEEWTNSADIDEWPKPDGSTTIDDGQDKLQSTVGLDKDGIEEKMNQKLDKQIKMMTKSSNTTEWNEAVSLIKEESAGLTKDEEDAEKKQLEKRIHELRAQFSSLHNRSCLMPSKDKVNLIPNKAREELRAYVASIASMYNQVHFHSFEHASHVTMSAQKLINKVILRNSQEIRAETEVVKKSEEVDLFFSTYGISADPLAQFAVVFTALVHDVEHTGVPNVQLITENTILAEKYKNKSVAENNSIQVAWSELLKPEYTNLRKCIFATDDDELRFRQLLINVVIATDIADRERRAGEGIRWKTAFGNVSNWGEEWDGKSDDELSKVDVSLKATVVLEQIVLASDVAHTMQHWLTYVKWNERLYKEMWAAYSSGRAEKDPTENWYRGEIGFFEHYIIPLATKLKECGVFGTAGDEYLGNAIRNKTEWIEKGEAIVKEFEAKIKMRRGGSDVGSNTESTSTS